MARNEFQGAVPITGVVEKCGHPYGENCQDILVSDEIEAGAKVLYQTSINLAYPGGWQHLSPHVRNRWRWRFDQAFNAYKQTKMKRVMKK